MRAWFIGLSQDYETKRNNVFMAFENGEVLPVYEHLKDTLLDVQIKPYKKKRSLDANAYYWVLITKLAHVLKTSNNELHNIMLRRYGALEIIENQAVYVVLPDTEEAEKKTNESETYHLKPTSQVKTGKDGKPYRTYMMIKGSHEYNTAEMSRLINGIVDECKTQGIETIPPEELERLLSKWKQ